MQNFATETREYKGREIHLKSDDSVVGGRPSTVFNLGKIEAVYNSPARSFTIFDVDSGIIVGQLGRAEELIDSHLGELLEAAEAVSLSRSKVKESYDTFCLIRDYNIEFIKRILDDNYLTPASKFATMVSYLSLDGFISSEEKDYILSIARRQRPFEEMSNLSIESLEHFFNPNVLLNHKQDPLKIPGYSLSLLRKLVRFMSLMCFSLNDETYSEHCERVTEVESFNSMAVDRKSAVNLSLNLFNRLNVVSIEDIEDLNRSEIMKFLGLFQLYNSKPFIKFQKSRINSIILDCGNKDYLYDSNSLETMSTILSKSEKQDLYDFVKYNPNHLIARTTNLSIVCLSGMFIVKHGVNEADLMLKSFFADLISIETDGSLAIIKETEFKELVEDLMYLALTDYTEPIEWALELMRISRDFEGDS